MRAWLLLAGFVRVLRADEAERAVAIEVDRSGIDVPEEARHRLGHGLSNHAAERSAEDASKRPRARHTTARAVTFARQPWRGRSVTAGESSQD